MTNIITKKSGLMFNVLHAKREIAKYFNYHEYFPFSNIGTKKGKYRFSRAHIYIVSVFEAILDKLFDSLVNEYVKNTDSNLKIVTKDVLLKTIRLNNCFKFIHTNEYKNETSYVRDIPIQERELKSFIFNRFNNTVVIKPDCRNALCFVIQCVYYDLCRHMHTLSFYSKKKTLGEECVKCAASLIFDDELYTYVRHRINSTYDCLEEEYDSISESQTDSETETDETDD